MPTDLILTKFKVGAVAVIPRPIVDRAVISESAEASFVADELAYSLRTYLWSHEVREVVREHIEYPATWWEAFKDRWCPSWLRRWVQVRKTSVAVRIMHVHVCPHLDFPDSTPVQHIRFLQGDSQP